MIASQQAGSDEAGHVDWIFRGTELWSVRQFHFLQIENSHIGLNGDSQHVDALIDALAANNCAPETLPSSGSKAA